MIFGVGEGLALPAYSAVGGAVACGAVAYGAVEASLAPTLKNGMKICKKGLCV